MTSQRPWGGAGAVGQRGTCWPHSAVGSGPARSCASGAVMRVQFGSGIIAQQRVKLVQKLLQAQEWADEKRKAKARRSLLKVSTCSGMGLVCVCRHSSTAVGRVVREVPSCGSAAPALWVLAAVMEEAGGDGGMELPSDEPPWECCCPDGCSSSSFPQDAQKLRAERTAARKEKLKQVGWSAGSSSELSALTALALWEDLGPRPSGPWGPAQPPHMAHPLSLQEKHLVAQLEEQLQAETEAIEVLRLQEEREKLELEGAWQQHQLELEAAHVPGAVLPELVEAELEKKERARRRGLAFWMKTICLIFVSLLLLLVAVLGSAVLYAQHYDQELLYRLLLRVLPQAMYASPAYFASRSLRVVCDGLLPI
ncbi:uncharacterized protein LOC121108682 isoform X2 [Gallus gallus]|uniref:uncharacterized protein LOC121108682 isoform X2 n=1 Tax=Gallus gallus TaxID=9031 RepID=UPI001AE30D51|nr:uncharacterized protein LOC121108682 isoform X2 [Gallus gallus]